MQHRRANRQNHLHQDLATEKILHEDDHRQRGDIRGNIVTHHQEKWTHGQSPVPAVGSSVKMKSVAHITITAGSTVGLARITICGNMKQSHDEVGQNRR